MPGPRMCLLAVLTVWPAQEIEGPCPRCPAGHGGLVHHPSHPGGCSSGMFSPSVRRQAGRRWAGVLAHPAARGDAFRGAASWGPSRRLCLFICTVCSVRGQGLCCHRRRPSVTRLSHLAVPALLGEGGQTPWEGGQGLSTPL